MTKVHFTKPYDSDGRLKILWLDDKGQKGEMMISEVFDRVPDSQRYSSWFSITSITDLEDLRIVKEQARVGPSTYEYECAEAPFDVYILDFRLCDDRENCTDEDHKTNGMHVPAVELVTGMLTALQWPSHPQAVIPYSGYSEEIGPIWELCWKFRPAGFHMAEPKKISKVRQDFGDLLTNKVASAYRMALRDAFAAGTAAIGRGERKTLARAISASPNGYLDAAMEVEIQTAYGLRSFALGVLFFDKKERGDNGPVVPATVVQRELIDVAAVDDPVVTKAAQLADLFWHLRLTEQSHRAYQAIRRDDPPSLTTEIPWIGAACWKGGRSKMPVETAQVIRLAILMLLICEHRLRVAASSLAVGEHVKDVLEFIDRVNYEGWDSEALLDWSENNTAAGRALQDAVSLQASATELGLGSALDVVALRLPLSSADLIRLFDPLPLPIGKDKTKYAKSLDSGNRVGAGLPGILSGDLVGDPSKSVDLNVLLLSTAAEARAMLLPTEWTALRKFAVGICGEHEMPGWLSVGSRL